MQSITTFVILQGLKQVMQGTRELAENVMDFRVCVVILNWDSSTDTIECLRSMFLSTYQNFTVVIVDNGSRDDSVSSIREYFSGEVTVWTGPAVREVSGVHLPFKELDSNESNLWNSVGTCGTGAISKSVVLIRCDSNLGFAEGNNVGISYGLRHLEPDLILILNSDTLLDSDSLAEMVRVVANHDDAGSVQARLMRMTDDDIVDSLGQEQLACGVIREARSGEHYTAQHDEPIPIFGACAAAALYRSEVFARVGFLDSAFFSLFEDVDLSWRLRLCGYSSFVAPQARVLHRRGISGSHYVSHIDINESRTFLSSRNSLWIVLRYYPLRYLLLYSPTFLLQFFIALASSMRLGICRKYLSGLWRQIGIRREIAVMFPAIRETQHQWIIRSSFSEYCRGIAEGGIDWFLHVFR